jgi:uncharacterized protein (TIGR03435 family)
MQMAALTALFSIAGHAQEATAPSFEVVSVKPGGTNIVRSFGPGGPFTTPQRGFRYSGERLTCNLPLQAIIREAWSLKDFQISGPDWLSTDLFDIAATMPAGTSKDTVRLMLRTMLEQRFAFRYHREHKDVPVYALVEAKAGFKLHPVTDLERQKQKVFDTPMGPRQGVASLSGRGRYAATAISIGDFADQISHYFDRPIVNLTNLDGLYEIDLQWTPEENGAPGQSLINDVELMRLIERQLGLKLDPRKLPYEILVIDHVEKKPTEN